MSKRLSYLPKLDSLRALAALMVLVSHYFVDLHGPNLHYGGNGVQIFFVISGFLITGILLSQKSSSTIRKPRLIVNFIIKRALRLFPVYYLFLIVLIVLSIFGGLWLWEKGGALYYFTYTQNYLFLKEGFQSSMLNHTWTLAVEEQFYLVWPFLIFLIPRKAELPVLITVFFIGIASRIYFIDFFETKGTVKGVTLIHLDTLATGALLAWSAFYKKERIINFLDKYSDLLFLLTLAVSIILTITEKFQTLVLPLSLDIMSLSLVFICAYKKWSFMNPVLNIGVLQQIGKISYGVYLFHKPVPYFFNYLYSKTGLPAIGSPVILFFIYVGVTLLIASLSWRFFEKPILRVKEKFDL